MANSKIITYDLRKPGRNYDDLYDAIRAYNIWAKIAESVWFISTQDTCAAVRDKLSKTVDANDIIFVGELTGIAAWKGLSTEVSEYLKSNL